MGDAQPQAPPGELLGQQSPSHSCAENLLGTLQRVDTACVPIKLSCENMELVVTHTPEEIRPKYCFFHLSSLIVLEVPLYFKRNTIATVLISKSKYVFPRF